MVSLHPPQGTTSLVFLSSWGPPELKTVWYPNISWDQPPQISINPRWPPSRKLLDRFWRDLRQTCSEGQSEHVTENRIKIGPVVFEKSSKIAIIWQYPENRHLEFSVKLMSKWNFDYGNRLGAVKSFRKDIKIINLAFGAQMVWDYLSDDARSVSAILIFLQNLAIDYHILHSYELTVVDM